MVLHRLDEQRARIGGRLEGCRTQIRETGSITWGHDEDKADRSSLQRVIGIMSVID